MKLKWTSTASSCARVAGNIIATGRVEHVPGSADDVNEWNWSATCRDDKRPNLGSSQSHNTGAAKSQEAAREAVEQYIDGFIKRFGASEAA